MDIPVISDGTGLNAKWQDESSYAPAFTSASVFKNADFIPE